MIGDDGGGEDPVHSVRPQGRECGTVWTWRTLGTRKGPRPSNPRMRRLKTITVAVMFVAVAVGALALLFVRESMRTRAQPSPVSPHGEE